MEPHDLVDGCALDFTAEPTSDEDLDALVMFAGVDPADVEAHAAELRKLAEPTS